MPPNFRLKAFCLLLRDNQMLLSKHFDKNRNDYFVRPLGGTVEFQERSEDTLRREIKEEIGAEIIESQLITVIEDIFDYRGEPYHDVVFLYQAKFADASWYQKDDIVCTEMDGAVFPTYWLSLEEVKENGYRLVPDGLEAVLKNTLLS